MITSPSREGLTLRLVALLVTLALFATCAGSPEPSAPADSTPTATASPRPSPSPTAPTTAGPTAAAATAAPATAAPAMGPQGSFDVGDRSLYIECVGSGSPTFIVETGEGMPIQPMNSLRDALGERGLACSYDRANKGRSGVAPTPRSGLDVVSDLDALLAAASVPGPYVMVGHSAGGLFVQLYAKQFPDDVIGVVAMNPVPPFEAAVAEIFPELTAEDVEAETSYYEGENGESLDYAAASETIDSLPAPNVPFELLISTSEQCGDHEGCLRTYPIFEQIMSDLADSWPQGIVTQIDTGHELFLRQDEVLEVVDSVFSRTER